MLILPESVVSAGSRTAFTESPCLPCLMLSFTLVTLEDWTCSQTVLACILSSPRYACPHGRSPRTLRWDLLRVASGPLPGLYQSTFRAELFANRVRIARASTSPFRIWTDCLGVVRKVRTLRSAIRPPAAMAPNSDLWLDVWHVLQDLPVTLDMNHLPSHDGQVVVAWEPVC